MEASMLKEVGASGQISLGKKYAGKLFDVILHPGDRFELVPIRVGVADLTVFSFATRGQGGSSERRLGEPVEPVEHVRPELTKSVVADQRANMLQGDPDIAKIGHHFLV
jgi:hypothetical protein